MVLDPSLLDWLLDADPALRWQVERDLVVIQPQVWSATRARVATEGDGARLLALQDADGQWAGGAYFPGSSDPPGSEPIEQEGQPWTATTWSLNTLRDWGLDPAALAGTADLLAANSRWEYDNLPYWDGEVDCCINAYTLVNGAWLGGSTRTSFHSTLNALRGLLDYQATVGADAGLRDACRAGEEYLLERRLLRTLSTGEPVGPWVARFAYPFRWFYSVLNAADYFRAAALYHDVAPDPRLADAMDVIRAARQPDGTWLQDRRHPGRVWFEVDVPAREPSKWLTFHATRVLAWWDGFKADQATPAQ